MSKPSEAIDSGNYILRITTLYIKPVAGELRHYEVLSHFSAFGDVDDVSIRNETKQSFGFIKFTLAKSAARALAVDCHVISGHGVEVVGADDKHQDKTRLLDLNDDCILEILSMKCLSGSDLCSTAEACCRLKELAVIAFKRQHKTKCDIE